MVSPIESVRKSPDSVKAKLLHSAGKLFGDFGYHGTTTRMIAKEVGVDISTLYYHWGEKGDIYKSVIAYLDEGSKEKLIDVAKKIEGLPLGQRIDIAIDELIDYLFEHPEIPNLLISRYFTKIRHDVEYDGRFPEFISGVAVTMGLADDKENVSNQAKMKMLFIMHAMQNFVTGSNFFIPILGVDLETYIKEAKEAIKFFLVPPFANMEKGNSEKNVI
ncbi:MAG: TetR/AcrR family transcriptional regulator [Desulfobacterales bacterium]|nr:TetR/AcrR family transcriptional regulator [Desulfobacteraceae bacterium]MBT4363025.1 TetR/AcrR family transcriptional regulator [Desulfobacteraceae bacterium]MBT7086010.1 TetR/AcrR family transcriptional regulator [Desulfobacterales bacterium]MBT7698054.1 TetR/AcrR family transcriptional regulator [Desulfobacterales bacterium]